MSCVDVNPDHGLG